MVLFHPARSCIRCTNRKPTVECRFQTLWTQKIPHGDLLVYSAYNALTFVITSARLGLSQLKVAFAKFSTNQQQYPLVYDTAWKGLVSSGAYITGDAGQDFGKYVLPEPQIGQDGLVMVINTIIQCLLQRPPLPLRLLHPHRSHYRPPRSTMVTIEQRMGEPTGPRCRQSQPIRSVFPLLQSVRLVPRPQLGEGPIRKRRCERRGIEQRRCVLCICYQDVGTRDWGSKYGGSRKLDVISAGKNVTELLPDAGWE